MHCTWGGRVAHRFFFFFARALPGLITPQPLALACIPQRVCRNNKRSSYPLAELQKQHGRMAYERSGFDRLAQMSLF